MIWFAVIDNCWLICLVIWVIVFSRLLDWNCLFACVFCWLRVELWMTVGYVILLLEIYCVFDYYDLFYMFAFSDVVCCVALWMLLLLCFGYLFEASFLIVCYDGCCFVYYVVAIYGCFVWLFGFIGSVVWFVFSGLVTLVYVLQRFALCFVVMFISCAYLTYCFAWYLWLYGPLFVGYAVVLFSLVCLYMFLYVGVGLDRCL